MSNSHTSPSACDGRFHTRQHPGGGAPILLPVPKMAACGRRVAPAPPRPAPPPIEPARPSSPPRGRAARSRRPSRASSTQVAGSAVGGAYFPPLCEVEPGGLHAQPVGLPQFLGGRPHHSRGFLRSGEQLREARSAWEGAGEELPSPRGGATARDAGPRWPRPVGEMPCGEDWLSHPLGIVQGFFGEWRRRGRAGRAAEFAEPGAGPRRAAPRGATSGAPAAETASQACADWR